MYCPSCTTTPLVLAQRQKVEIDYCPHCRGVWLDRGELDKLLERAAGKLSDKDEAVGDDDEALAPRGRVHGRRPRHRKSWLSEILD